MATISGTVIKGPIKGALVQVFKLYSDGTKGELLGSAPSGSDASYAVQIPTAKAVPPLLVTVSGQTGATYTSETTGKEVNFTPAESFNAILDTFDPAKKYTVSPLTDAAYQQVQKFLTESPTAVADTGIISAANRRIATLFNVSDVLADPSTDISYLTSLKIIDQMVEDAKAKGATNTLQTVTLINQAFVDVNSKPYQNYQAALTAAAAVVATKDPTIATVVNTIVSAVAAPPAEPVWTDKTAPQMVLNLKALAGAESATVSSVTLTWSPATTTGKNPVTGYDVYRNGTKIASVAATRFVDKPLAQATAFTYVVVAFDAAGNCALPGEVVKATTPSAPNLTISVGGQLSSSITTLPFKDNSAPTVPANLVASTTAIDATTSSVKLTWTAVTDNVAVTGYDVYRDGNKIATTTLTTVTDPSGKNGIAYSYTVVAFDAAGNRSAASTALAVTPVAANLGINVGGQVL
jgi:chitodextrinase